MATDLMDSHSKSDIFQWICSNTSTLHSLDKLESVLNASIAYYEKEFKALNGTINDQARLIVARINRLAFTISTRQDDLDRFISEILTCGDGILQRSNEIKENMCFRSVQEVDVERTNLGHTLALLQKSQQWSQTLLALNKHIYEMSDKHNEAHGLFKTLDTCLADLSHLPGHNNRLNKWNSIRNHWKAILVPHLSEAFGLDDYRIIKREVDELRAVGLYKFVLKVFTDYKTTQFTSSHKFDFITVQSLLEVGERYLNTTHEQVVLEVDFCQAVFGSPLALLLYANALISLRVDGLCEVGKRSPMQDAITFKKRADTFVREIAQLTDICDIPRSEECDVGQGFLALALTLGKIFVTAVNDYVEYETKCANEQLDDNPKWIGVLGRDQTPVFSKMLSKLIKYSAESFSRCTSLTHGMLICEYYVHLEKRFVKFAQMLTSLLDILSGSTNIDFSQIEQEGGNTSVTDNDMFLQFRLFTKMMVLVGQFIELFESYGEKISNLVRGVRKAPMASDGIGNFAIKDAAQRLFTTIDELNIKCEQILPANNNTEQPLFVQCRHAMKSLCSDIQERIVKTFVSPVEKRLCSYCREELDARSISPLLSGLPAYSVCPSSSVSETTKHVLIFAQSIDQYMPKEKDMVLRAANYSLHEHLNDTTDADDVGHVWIERGCVQIVEQFLAQICHLQFGQLNDQSFKQIFVDLEQMQAMLEHVGASRQTHLWMILKYATTSSEGLNEQPRDIQLPATLRDLASRLKELYAKNSKH